MKTIVLLLLLLPSLAFGFAREGNPAWILRQLASEIDNLRQGEVIIACEYKAPNGDTGIDIRHVSSYMSEQDALNTAQANVLGLRGKNLRFFRYDWAFAQQVRSETRRAQMEQNQPHPTKHPLTAAFDSMSAICNEAAQIQQLIEPGSFGRTFRACMGRAGY
jgi:hypothetical protein